MASYKQVIKDDEGNGAVSLKDLLNKSGNESTVGQGTTVKETPIKSGSGAITGFKPTENAPISTMGASKGTAQPASATNNAGGYQYAGGFQYEGYQDPDIVTQAWDAIEQQKANAPGEWGGGTWMEQLSDTLNQIMNREKFSYDLNGDVLYHQYKDMGIQQGKMAMMDTMGQAQAMTGGYGNSYAQSVGQQAYQSHLQELNDIIPELYQMALDQYNQEGQDLYNQAALMAQMEDREYGIYRDEVSDYNAELDRLTEDARYKAEDAYGKWYDNTNMQYDDYWKSKNYDYQVEQDAKEEAWRQKEYDLAVDKWNFEQEQTKLAAAGGNSGNGGDTGTEFHKATYSRTDPNTGNLIWYINGKEVIREPGANPYTGTVNPDVKNGYFPNSYGYQPDNIGGKKLSESGITDVVNGVTQNVWKTPDGKLWIWDGTKNKYLEYDDGSEPPAKKYAASAAAGGGKTVQHLFN